MAERVKLTRGRIERFEPEQGKSQSFLWDTEAPGLAVRATPNGRKTYIFQGRVHGEKGDFRLTIGDVATFDIDTAVPVAAPQNQLFAPGEGARQIARRLQSLCDAGVDPRRRQAEMMAAKVAEIEAEQAAEQSEANQQRRELVTVGEAWARYIAARSSKWSARHLADHVSLSSTGGEAKRKGKGTMMAAPLAVLMPVKLADLTPERMAAWLKEETRTRPTRAALAFRLLRACLRWCSDESDYKAVVRLDAIGKRVAKDFVPKPKAKEGDCLQREMLPGWFTEVRKLDPVLGTYLQALLLTGARREEMASLLWADVDFKWGSLRIRDKVEGERVIPLTPYLAELLRTLKTRNDKRPEKYRILNGKKIENDLKNWKPSPHVFSSATSETGRLADATNAHRRVLAAAALPHVSLHGLRRSFGTLSEWVECPVGVVAQIQGHKPSAIAERHYRRRPLDLLRSWHIKIEAWILEQAGIELVTNGQQAGPKLATSEAA